MFYLIEAATFFFLFAATHIIAVRLKLVTIGSPKFFLIAGFWFGALVICMLWLSHSSGDLPNRSVGVLEIPLGCSSLLIYLMLNVWYWLQCDLLIHESPSLKIFRLIDEHEDGKITREELRRVFTNEEVVLSRLNGLVFQGYVSFHREQYLISPKGALIARIFQTYRALLGRGVGG